MHHKNRKMRRDPEIVAIFPRVLKRAGRQHAHQPNDRALNDNVQNFLRFGRNLVNHCVNHQMAVLACGYDRAQIDQIDKADARYFFAPRKAQIKLTQYHI